MKIKCEGIAVIRHRDTNREFHISSDELEWKVISSTPRENNHEYQYGANFNHADLGSLHWRLIEYPVGTENQSVTIVGDHILVKDFEYSLEPEAGRELSASEIKDQFLKSFQTPDTFPQTFPVRFQSAQSTDELLDDFIPKNNILKRFQVLDLLDEFDNRTWTLNEETVEQIVTWFFANYEDPANSVSYNGEEGGYLFEEGPYEAIEILSEEYEDLSHRTIDAAVQRIEEDGILEWVPISGSPDFSGGDFDRRDFSAEQFDFENWLAIAARSKTRNYGSAEELEIRRDIQEKIPALMSALPETPEHGGLGHNRPPDELQLDGEQLRSAKKGLKAIDEELAKTEPDIEVVAKSASSLQKIIGWAAKKLDLALDEFCKSFGSELGKWSARAPLAAVLTSPYWGGLAELFLSLKDWFIQILGS